MRGRPPALATQLATGVAENRYLTGEWSLTCPCPACATIAQVYSLALAGLEATPA